MAQVNVPPLGLSYTFHVPIIRIDNRREEAKYGEPINYYLLQDSGYRILIDQDPRGAILLDTEKTGRLWVWQVPSDVTWAGE